MKLRFIIGQSLLFLVLSIVALFLDKAPAYQVSSAILFTSLVYFAVIHIFSGFYFFSHSLTEQKRKVFLIMVMRSSKFLLTLFFVLTMILIEPEHKKQVGLSIVVLYAVYTITEVIFFKFMQNVDS